MIWTDTPCRTTCWNDGNRTVEALRSPKIECIVAQHPWLENDCLIADIILPANTTLEVERPGFLFGMGPTNSIQSGCKRRGHGTDWSRKATMKLYWDSQADGDEERFRRQVVR